MDNTRHTYTQAPRHLHTRLRYLYTGPRHLHTVPDPSGDGRRSKVSTGANPSRLFEDLFHRVGEFVHFTPSGGPTTERTFVHVDKRRDTRSLCTYCASGTHRCKNWFVTDGFRPTVGTEDTHTEGDLARLLPSRTQSRLVQGSGADKGPPTRVPGVRGDTRPRPPVPSPTS